MKGLFKKIILILVISLFLLQCLIPLSAEKVNKETLKIQKNSNSSFENIIFDLQMKLLMKKGSYPSISTCIIKNNSIIWEKSYGYRDIKNLKKPNNQTIYGLGSVTKTITATAYMKIFEDGYFKLDDNVNSYLPFELRHPDYPEIPITVENLLYHRASIYDYCISTVDGVFDLISYFVQYDDFGDFLKDILTEDGRLYNKEYWLGSKPDNLTRYSNLGYAILGYMFKFITNQSLEDYCQENIFIPLEMYNTSYHITNLRLDNVAVPYFKRLGLYLPLPYYDTKGFAGMGGIRTTLTDISHFLIMHMNNGTYKDVRILDNETINLMHNTCYKGYVSPGSKNLPSRLKKWGKRNFGIGWWSTENWFDEKIDGHGGMMPGYVSFIMTNLSEKIGFIVLSNHMDVIEFHENIKFFLKTDAYMQMGNLLLKKARTL